MHNAYMYTRPAQPRALAQSIELMLYMLLSEAELAFDRKRKSHALSVDCAFYRKPAIL